jgi:uncharacterized membrane protein
MGVLWLGMLYSMAFAGNPALARLDDQARRAVLPELIPRQLFWGRVGAAWTWLSGILLLGLVYHAGGMMFAAERGWGPAAGIASLLPYLAPFVYELMVRSALARSGRLLAALTLALVVVLWRFCSGVAGLGYEATSIHVGAILGTIMAYNVWFRIAPAQRAVAQAVRDGQVPAESDVALASTRVRHNAYLSAPLLWTMLTAHTTVLGYGRLLPESWGALGLVAVTLLGWHVIWHLFRRASKLQGL